MCIFLFLLLIIIVAIAFVVTQLVFEKNLLHERYVHTLRETIHELKREWCVMRTITIQKRKIKRSKLMSF